jgi:hypothetical protein
MQQRGSGRAHHGLAIARAQPRRRHVQPRREARPRVAAVRAVHARHARARQRDAVTTLDRSGQVGVDLVQLWHRVLTGLRNQEASRATAQSNCLWRHDAEARLLKAASGSP